MFKESCVNNDNDCSVIKYNIFVDPKYAMTEFHLIFEHYFPETDLDVEEYVINANFV